MTNNAGKVGYGRPPENTRFKPGVSGNPKGRPKGVHNFKSDLNAALKSRVNVTKDGQQKRVSAQEAAILRLFDVGLRNGNIRALHVILELARIYNNEDAASPADQALDPDDDAALKAFFQRHYGEAKPNPPPRMKSKAKAKAKKRKRS